MLVTLSPTRDSRSGLRNGMRRPRRLQVDVDALGFGGHVDLRTILGQQRLVAVTTEAPDSMAASTNLRATPVPPISSMTMSELVATLMVSVVTMALSIHGNGLFPPGQGRRRRSARSVVRYVRQARPSARPAGVQSGNRRYLRPAIQRESAQHLPVPRHPPLNVKYWCDLAYCTVSI